MNSSWNKIISKVWFIICTGYREGERDTNDSNVEKMHLINMDISPEEILYFSFDVSRFSFVDLTCCWSGVVQITPIEAAYQLARDKFLSCPHYGVAQ